MNFKWSLNLPLLFLVISVRLQVAKSECLVMLFILEYAHVKTVVWVALCQKLLLHFTCSSTCHVPCTFIPSGFEFFFSWWNLCSLLWIEAFMVIVSNTPLSPSLNIYLFIHPSIDLSIHISIYICIYYLNSVVFQSLVFVFGVAWLTWFM